MAGENSTITTTKTNSESPVGVSSLEVDTYSIYYETYNHMLESGIRLLDTNVTDGNAEELKIAFRQLLPCDVDENMICSVKLTPLSSKHRKYHANRFGQFMLNLKFKHLRMFLIHYPAAPNTYAKNSMNVNLPTESWLAISKCKEMTRVNALGVFNMSIKHEINLSEVVAVGPQVQRMLWYTYYRYSYTDTLFTNLSLIDNPVVAHLARQYNLTNSELLLLWALQRGETIKPRLGISSFQMENVRLPVRLHPYDLTRLDIAIIRVSSGTHPRLI